LVGDFCVSDKSFSFYKYIFKTLDERSDTRTFQPIPESKSNETVKRKF
jgi:hypothetical protein